MDVAEFDKFAEEYLQAHAQNIRISGEQPDYFARYKIEEIRRRWTRPEPGAVLDFGAGIGNSLPHLKAAFPEARLVGIDVSEKSLAVAANRFPGVAELVRYDGGEPPLPDASFDLVFSACVFHHIPETEHVPLLMKLKRLLRPGGVLAIFEHNPVNPVTRYIVASCPFDENAVLIPAPVFARRQREAGFRDVQTAFTGFFPGALRALRPLERFMTPLPIGAQYYTWPMPSSGLGGFEPHLRQVWILVRFGLAGLINTAVGFSIIAGLDLGLHVEPHLANACGYAVGIAIGFVLNRGFVFKSDGHIGRTGAKYLVAVAVGFVANQAVLAAVLPVYGPGAIGRLGAQLTGMATYTLLLFALCKGWVFRNAKAAA